MAKTKQLNVSSFTKLVKELTAVGELIRVKQDEKQSVMNDFDKEKSSYKSGKISQSTLVSSVKKTNSELMKLDNGIRSAISRSKSIGDQIRKMVSNQSPISFRATIAGVASSRKKSKKKVVRKRVVKRKPAKKNPIKKKRK